MLCREGRLGGTVFNASKLSIGCHCTGDMAVRMSEVLARPWFAVCAPCFKFLTNCYKFQLL